MGKNVLIRRKNPEQETIATPSAEEIAEPIPSTSPLSEVHSDNSTPQSTKQTVPVKSKKWKLLFGLFCIFSSILLAVSLVTHLFIWWRDFDILQNLHLADIFFKTDQQLVNIGGRLGGFFAFLLINKGFGIASFIFPYGLFLAGLDLLRLKRTSWLSWGVKSLFFLLWLSILLSTFFYSGKWGILGGNVGYHCSQYLIGLIGKLGLLVLLFFLALSFLILKINLSTLHSSGKFGKLFGKHQRSQDPKSFTVASTNSASTEKAPSSIYPKTTISQKLESQKKEIVFTLHTDKDDNMGNSTEASPDPHEEKLFTLNISPDATPVATPVSTPAPAPEAVLSPVVPDETATEEQEPVIEMKVIDTTQEKISTDLHPKENVRTEANLSIPYDPTLELSSYKFPTIDLLVDFGDQTEDIEERKEELMSNKKRIIDILKTYYIEISEIKATIGPTVTLYEIVPAPGVRISKIKGLEDDIALSLSALGIRIIAPIPGKGTIGIEVPNIKKQIVPMREMITCPDFLDNHFELPIAIGKTISNKPYVIDLAKLPHLLVAGATGQGKSVGLNAIIGSLLYKKHPAELKFVMVDPKKVELSIYSKIERHFLAKIPNTEEAIITDTKKVVQTLNSLCIEMDNRYDLLKNAQVRNIKEYNQKFIARRLNPLEGHRFLPYIVLVIDEYADLIMTAGKDVELPIARLAQLARAIGIHLIIATQRPSVNIITGAIKANFPARIAFKVSSKIDSRTILDTSGADQLIGRGDMLISTGNELTRLQCPFIDTPEIEAITEFIGNQRGFSDAYLLPESQEDDPEGSDGSYAPDERDDLFEEAARLVVSTQLGSTSALQRKMKLGYNRAGRIIDQLEDAGIVGPSDGKKTREVLIQDFATLDKILSNIEE